MKCKVKLFFLFFSIVIANLLFAQPYNTVNECKKNVDVTVEIERIEPMPDSVSNEKKAWGTYIRSCFKYQLAVKKSDYTIEEFRITGKYDNGDVVEILNEGACFSARVLKLINDFGKNRELYIFCIKAKDKYSKEYILKPFYYIFR